MSIYNTNDNHLYEKSETMAQISIKIEENRCNNVTVLINRSLFGFHIKSNPYK